MGADTGLRQSRAGQQVTVIAMPDDGVREPRTRLAEILG